MDDRQIGQLLEVKDPAMRAQMAASAIDEQRLWMTRLAMIRAHALLELVDGGATVTGLAEQLGISRQQVHRLIREARGTAYRGPVVPEA